MVLQPLGHHHCHTSPQSNPLSRTHEAVSQQVGRVTQRLPLSAHTRGCLVGVRPRGHANTSHSAPKMVFLSCQTPLECVRLLSVEHSAGSNQSRQQQAQLPTALSAVTCHRFHQIKTAAVLAITNSLALRPFLVDGITSDGTDDAAQLRQVFKHRCLFDTACTSPNWRLSAE